MKSIFITLAALFALNACGGLKEKEYRYPPSQDKVLMCSYNPGLCSTDTQVAFSGFTGYHPDKEEVQKALTKAFIDSMKHYYGHTEVYSTNKTYTIGNKTKRSTHLVKKVTPVDFSKLAKIIEKCGKPQVKIIKETYTDKKLGYDILKFSGMGYVMCPKK